MSHKLSIAFLGLAGLLVMSAAAPQPTPSLGGRSGASAIVLSPAGKEDHAFAAALAKEAAGVFQDIKAKAIAGDFDGIRNRLFDNGRPVGPQARWEELARDMAREVPILSAAPVKAAPLSKALIERQVRYQVDGGKDIVSTGEILTVTFALTATEGIGKKEFPNLQGTSTVAADGTLIVVMKKIDGKWYWNPFAW